MPLPRLSNKEFERVEKLLRERDGVDTCPTCGAKPIKVTSGVWGWENGTYKLDGETYPCDCETQKKLHRHYLLANIGDQYQRLDWDTFIDQNDIKSSVDTYIKDWESYKRLGMGVEVSSPNMGVGKTFIATHIGKELIKQGERVYFMDFRTLVGLLDNPERHDIEEKLHQVTVLILDEVFPPYTSAQADYFSAKFEELIRDRTNFNRVTIMTTNLTPAKLRKIYPRTYSLLEAKQIRIEIKGEDARRKMISDRNLEQALADEVGPIT